MIRFGTVNASDCIYIAKHMRERDRREISAVTPHFEPSHFGMYVYRHFEAFGVAGLIASLEKRPVAVVTLTADTPRSAQATMFATDEFDQIGKALTRHMLKTVLPFVTDKGLTRVEARCWEGHEKARKWMERLGAKQEAVIRGYGANGETFIQMAWTKCV